MGWALGGCGMDSGAGGNGAGSEDCGSYTGTVLELGSQVKCQNQSAGEERWDASGKRGPGGLGLRGQGARRALCRAVKSAGTLTALQGEKGP